MFPKATLLSLLAKGLADGTIDPHEVRDLLPREKPARTGKCRVDRDIRGRVADLSEQFGLVADGMRIRAQRVQASGNLVLYLYRGIHFAERGLSESFTGIEDVDAAAERLVAQYLRRLDEAKS